MSPMRLKAITSGLLLLLTASVPVLANSDSSQPSDPAYHDHSTHIHGPEDGQIITPDAYLQIQAEQYASDFDVDLEEAVRRLELQPYISELTGLLEANDMDVYAELRADNGPVFQVIVQVAAGGEDRVHEYVSGGPLADIVVIETVRWTLEELRSHQQDLTSIAADLGLEMDSGISNQKVIMHVTDVQHAREQIEQAQAVLPESVLMVEVPFLATSTSHLGGDLLGGVGFDPSPPSDCTTGFAGRRKANGVKGIITAGHCGNDEEWGHELLPRYNFSSAKADAQLLGNSSGENLRNIVWIGGGTWVPINSLYWRTGSVSIYIGQQICKMGKTTGYTCGVVDDKNFDPNGSGIYEGFNRDPVFILMKDNTELSDGGDSGGPWIGATGAQHNAAFGIQSGIVGAHSNYHWAFFTPMDPIFTSHEVLVSCPGYYC